MLDYLFKQYGWNRLHWAGMVELLMALDEATMSDNGSAKEALERAICKRGG